jgi:hypothetical protein
MQTGIMADMLILSRLLQPRLVLVGRINSGFNGARCKPLLQAESNIPLFGPGIPEMAQAWSKEYLR